MIRNESGRMDNPMQAEMPSMGIPEADDETLELLRLMKSLNADRNPNQMARQRMTAENTENPSDSALMIIDMGGCG